MAQYKARTTYFDCDTTPPLKSRYLPRAGSFDAIQDAAFKMLRGIDEGQIGVYSDHFGNGFLGYAIKYKGDAPYFETAPANDT